MESYAHFLNKWVTQFVRKLAGWPQKIRYLILISTFLLYVLTLQKVPLVLSALVSFFFAVFIVVFFTQNTYRNYNHLVIQEGILALMRIGTGSVLLFQLLEFRVLSTIQIPHSVAYTDSFMSFLNTIPGYSELLQNTFLLSVLYYLLVGGLLFTIMGLWTRFVIPVSAFLYVIVSSAVMQYFGLWHEGLLAWYMLTALSFVPCERAFSIDSISKKHRDKDKNYSQYYLFILVIVALVYFSLGMSKVSHTGVLGWIQPYALKGHILEGLSFHYGQYYEIVMRLPDWVFYGFGTLTLLTQLFFWLILFSNTARLIWPILGIVLSFGICIVMNITFYDLIFFSTFLIGVWVYQWREQRKLSVTTVPPSKAKLSSVQKTGFTIVIFFLLLQLHGYIEQYPFTSWDMYSHPSEMHDKGYITRSAVHTEGVRIDRERLPAFKPYMAPTKCYQFYSDIYYDTCQRYFKWYAMRVTAIVEPGAQFVHSSWREYVDPETGTRTEGGKTETVFPIVE